MRVCVGVTFHCKRVVVTVADCSYRDAKDVHYMGKKHVTNIDSSGKRSVHNCQSWSVQDRQTDSVVPNGCRNAAVNFCRSTYNMRGATTLFLPGIGLIASYFYCKPVVRIESKSRVLDVCMHSGVAVYVITIRDY